MSTPNSKKIQRGHHFFVLIAIWNDPGIKSALSCADPLLKNFFDWKCMCVWFEDKYRE